MGNLVKDVWQWLKDNAAPVAVVITIITATIGGGYALGEDHPDVARVRNNLGMAWQSKGEYDKAIEYYEQALASDLKTLGEDHPSVAIRRNNLGSAWDAKGEYDKAIEYYELALASGLKTFREDHPDVAKFRNNLAAAKAPR